MQTNLCNKWGIYKDHRAMWWYTIPYTNFMEATSLLPLFFSRFMQIGIESGLTSLTNSNYATQDLIDDFAKEWISKSKTLNYLPPVSNETGSWVDQETDFVLSTHYWLYNNKCQTEMFEFNHKNCKEILTKISYGGNRTSFMPFHYRITDMPFEKRICLTVGLRSDLWLDEVVCVHCVEADNIRPRDRRLYDNRELSQLNRNILNAFMKNMYSLIIASSGNVELDHGGLGQYEGLLLKDKLLSISI